MPDRLAFMRPATSDGSKQPPPANVGFRMASGGEEPASPHACNRNSGPQPDKRFALDRGFVTISHGWFEADGERSLVESHCTYLGLLLTLTLSLELFEVTKSRGDEAGKAAKLQ